MNTIGFSIFQFLNYRDYLKKAYAHFKESKPSFSYRYFAKKAGLKSPALLKMVMSGERNLSPRTTKQFIAGLSLHGLEADYFRLLVRYNQTTHDAEKNRYLAKLRKYLERSKVNLLSLQQYDYFSNWFIPVIREMIPCEGFERSPQRIASLLRNTISPEEVSRALELLMKLGLVSLNPKGRLVQKVPHLKTDDDVHHLALKNYHREMLDRAGRSIESSHPEKRELQALTLGIDPEKIPLAKKRIREFVAEMRELLRGGRKRQVYQLNVQFFNHTEDPDL